MSQFVMNLEENQISHFRSPHERLQLPSFENTFDTIQQAFEFLKKSKLKVYQHTSEFQESEDFKKFQQVQGTLLKILLNKRMKKQYVKALNEIIQILRFKGYFHVVGTEIDQELYFRLMLQIQLDPDLFTLPEVTQLLLFLAKYRQRVTDDQVYLHIKEQIKQNIKTLDIYTQTGFLKILANYYDQDFEFIDIIVKQILKFEGDINQDTKAAWSQCVLGFYSNQKFWSLFIDKLKNCKTQHVNLNYLNVINAALKLENPQVSKKMPTGYQESIFNQLELRSSDFQEDIYYLINKNQEMIFQQTNLNWIKEAKLES